MKSIAVIINASAGLDDKQEIAEKLAAIFAASGVEASITLADTGEKLIEAARDAIAQKPSVIVAGGGDGTLNAIAALVVDTKIALGVLPLGTLNHFAKDLQIPLDPEDAARNILEGHTVSVDVGEVNGKIFLNNSSLGIYPRIVRHRERQQRLGFKKWPAFAWATMTVLRRYIFLSVALQTATGKIVRRTPFVFIGNNEYQMETLNMGGRTCINAGLLSVFLAHRTGRWGLLRLAVRALFGSLREAKEFDTFCTKEIVIETRHKTIDVATDGEVNRMDTPLSYRTRAGALRVIVPISSTVKTD